MAEVTKQDIEKVHSRIDDLVTVNTSIQVSIGKIEQRFEDLKIPEQPCCFIKKHLKNHQHTASLWQKPLVRTVIDLVKMAIVATAAYLFASSKARS